MHKNHLHALFDRLADEELLARVAAGGLTDEALALARAEIRARGLPLPAVPPAAPPAALQDSGDWLLLERGLSPTEAHLLCTCLQAAGLRASAGDTHLVQAHSLLSIAVGGACVRVPVGELAEAREVLAAFRRGEFALGDDFDPGA